MNGYQYFITNSHYEEVQLRLRGSAEFWRKFNRISRKSFIERKSGFKRLVEILICLCPFSEIFVQSALLNIVVIGRLYIGETILDNCIYKIIKSMFLQNGEISLAFQQFIE